MSAQQRGLRFNLDPFAEPALDAALTLDQPDVTLTTAILMVICVQNGVKRWLREKNTTDVAFVTKIRTYLNKAYQINYNILEALSHAAIRQAWQSFTSAVDRAWSDDPETPLCHTIKQLWNNVKGDNHVCYAYHRTNYVFDVFLHRGCNCVCGTVFICNLLQQLRPQVATSYLVSQNHVALGITWQNQLYYLESTEDGGETCVLLTPDRLWTELDPNLSYYQNMKTHPQRFVVSLDDALFHDAFELGIWVLGLHDQVNALRYQQKRLIADASWLSEDWERSLPVFVEYERQRMLLTAQDLLSALDASQRVYTTSQQPMVRFFHIFLQFLLDPDTTAPLLQQGWQDWSLLVQQHEGAKTSPFMAFYLQFSLCKRLMNCISVLHPEHAVTQQLNQLFNAFFDLKPHKPWPQWQS